MGSVLLRRSEEHIEAPSGRRLYCRTWAPASVEGAAILIVHGFGEHSGRYEAMARWLAERGRRVHAYDQMGHGLSSGARGHVTQFEDYLDDLEFMLGRVSALPNDPLPVLVGHSLGGLIAATLACERAPAISRLVLSGPALALGGDVSRGRVAAARLLRRFVPRFSMEAGLDPDALSRDPEVVRGYREDPWVHGRMSASLAVGMMERQATTSTSAGEVLVPTLLMHGESDALCPVDRSRIFFEGLSEGVASRSEIRTYPGLRHEIFNEPEREEIFQHLFRWLKETETSQ